jgi:hypothetical protein
MKSATRRQFPWVLAIVLAMAANHPASAADQAMAAPQASALTVEPRPTPVMPEGNAGIAAMYPGDVGIEKDPDVVFVESFEGSVDEICSRWESVAGKPIMSTSDEVVPGSGGKQSLLLTRVAGGTDGYMDGGNLYRRLKNPQGGYGYDQLFFRFYMKFNQSTLPIHHYGSGLVGFTPPTPWAQGGAGERPQADARWSSQVEPGRLQYLVLLHYWQRWEVVRLVARPGATVSKSACRLAPSRRRSGSAWKIMVKMNDVGDTNGEQAYWLDGKLSRNEDGQITSYLGKRFPFGRHLDLRQVQAVRDRAGRRLGLPARQRRLDRGRQALPRLCLEKHAAAQYQRRLALPLHVPTGKGTSKVWWDHLVVARSTLGP